MTEPTLIAALRWALSPPNTVCCPKCGRPFSQWFTWEGNEYCYPCWEDSGHNYNNMIIFKHNQIK